MSKLLCRCGYVFHDNADFLSFKASFRADQDEDDYYLAMEDGIDADNFYYADMLYTNRNLYQCPECGRIFIEDNKNGNQYYCFAPESEEISHRLLESAEGENWKGFLHGDWQFPKPEFREHAGDIIVNVNSEERAYLVFDDYDAFKQKFDALFQELTEKNLLRSALLRKDKHILFRWSDDEYETAP